MLIHLGPAVPPQHVLLDDHDPRPPALGALRLDSALSLLEHSGHPLPARDDPAWLQAVIDALCDLSSRDPLTTLANRRQFELEVGRELARVARAGEAALVLVADIDHFKTVNDTHGHPVGDQVIKAVALALLDCVRPTDTVARLGGEEFAIILPNCAADFGQTVAERIRERVEGLKIEAANGNTVSVTISLGGAFAPQWVRSTPSLWIDRADRQLYLAKSSGRNRACLEQSALPQVSAEEKSLLFRPGLSMHGPAAAGDGDASEEPR
jgi:diguanylate cyclase (GGDEF)-like protein